MLIHAEIGSVVAASSNVNLGVRRRGRVEGREPPLWYAAALPAHTTRAVAPTAPPPPPPHSYKVARTLLTI
ncbi:hypothetical protein L0Y59_00450, partial [Candidatus Uhrbacteria bacterium]|nr:hypothetical protein [Candidatus Uhrbacteria bacterium]